MLWLLLRTHGASASAGARRGFSNPVLANLFTEYADGYYFADEQNGHIEGFLQREMAMDLIGLSFKEMM